MGVASDTWRLARDARPETPPERRLTDVQRAELEERVKRRTMDLAWAMTKRQVEATARAVVDSVLGKEPRGHGLEAADTQAEQRPASDGTDVTDVTDAAAASGPTWQQPPPESGAEEGFVLAGLTADERRARAEALVLIGGIFSGERPHERVDRAVAGLHQLAATASSRASKAKSFLGNLVASAATPRAQHAEATEVHRGAQAASSAPPPPELGAFFREMGSWRQK